jgi:hypothetical protein
MSLNSVQFNRLINKKRNIDAAWGKPTHQAVANAHQVTNHDFNDKRQSDILQRGAARGKLVSEKILQASKDEQEYFKKINKIYTKEAIKESVYKRQIPEFFRIMEDPSRC